MKKILMTLGTVCIGAALVTGCHTVEGTVKGAGQDIQAVSNAMEPQPKRVHHHTVKKHRVKQVKKVEPMQMDEAQDAATPSAGANHSY